MIAAHSSPDNTHNLTSLPGSEQSKQSDLDSTKTLPPCSPLPITDVSLSAFERRIAEASLPPPGPSHYSARRQLWLAQTGRSPPPPAPSTSRERLEELLSMPGAATNDEVWKAGVERVWRGLVTGGRLKRRLPMNLVVCTFTVSRMLYRSPLSYVQDQDNTCWVVKRSRDMACRCGRPRTR